ncbi:MAG: ATP-binding protein [Alphaproteobacteria bacterium]
MNLLKYIKLLLPRSLLGRGLLIIFLPLLLLQIISIWVFLDRHVDQVSWRLANSLAAEIHYTVDQIEAYPQDQDKLLETAKSTFEFEALSLDDDAILPNQPALPLGYIGSIVERAMAKLARPVRVDDRNFRDSLTVKVQLPQGVLNIKIPGKRLFSVTIIVFILWMLGSSIILFGIAAIFMRNQVRPLKRLALAAESFGKGLQDKQSFKLEGALEVRQAAIAFNQMKERIRRQIRQRTDMLSAVGHDLRTPITRMQLQIEMMDGEDQNRNDLQADLKQMHEMIEAYLAFARGQGEERTVELSLNALMDKINRGFLQDNVSLDIHLEGEISFMARPIAMRRLFDNLINNATRYAKTIRLYIAKRSNQSQFPDFKHFIEILLDDDGPGIPEDQRKHAFQPFIRLEKSRNPSTGGTGLGLSIAQDIVNAHGGKIQLETSPLGGLRVRIRLPI